MNTEKIMEDIQSVQDNIREIKSTWGNTIMTLDNIKSGLKADVQKKVDEAYQRGLEDGRKVGIKDGMCDAWEVARKIGHASQMKMKEMGFDFTDKDWCYNPSWYVVMNYTASEAIEKLKAYEEKQKADDKIEVGDIVDRYIDGKFDSRGIYLGGNGEIWDCLFWANTLPITLAFPKEQFKKTGKRYDIQSIFEAMRS